MAEFVLGHSLPDHCKAFTTTAQRFGAREIQAGIRGKAARRIAINGDHGLVVATHDGHFVGATYIEPYPELAGVLGEPDAFFLRWLIVDDVWRGRVHRDDRVADVIMARTLDVVRHRGTSVAAGLVHVEQHHLTRSASPYRLHRHLRPREPAHRPAVAHGRPRRASHNA